MQHNPPHCGHYLKFCEENEIFTEARKVWGDREEQREGECEKEEQRKGRAREREEQRLFETTIPEYH